MKKLNFDSFDESQPAGPPIELDDKPKVGSKVGDKKIVRVKAINASSLTAIALQQVEVDDNLKFKQHFRRPFVFWLCEVA